MNGGIDKLVFLFLKKSREIKVRLEAIGIELDGAAKDRFGICYFVRVEQGCAEIAEEIGICGGRGADAAFKRDRLAKSNDGLARLADRAQDFSQIVEVGS